MRERWNLAWVMAMCEWIETNLQWVDLSVTTHPVSRNQRQSLIKIQVQKHFLINTCRLGWIICFLLGLLIGLIGLIRQSTFIYKTLQYLRVPVIYLVMCWRSRSQSSRRVLFHPLLLRSCYFPVYFAHRTKTCTEQNTVNPVLFYFFV